MSLKRISLLLFLLIACACAIALSQLTWKIISLSLPSSPPSISSSASAPTASNTANNALNTAIKAIREQSLFGQAIAAQSPYQALPDQEDIKQTRLNIQLLGLVHGTNSVAVVNYEGKQGAYLVGEVIGKKGGREVSLATIEADHVIIYNNGEPEKLLLPKDKAAPRGAESKAASRSSHSASLDKTIDLTSTQYRRLVGNDPKMTLMTNPLSLSKFMMLSPVNANGALKGYRITAGPDKRLLATSGINTGDIVTHIDNTPVSSLDITALYQLLQSANSVSLTLDRDGQPLNMDIKL